MTVGSLFAGIGGFDLGFERAGFEIKWQVEIDPFCQAVLAKHWPDVRRYNDVRRVHGWRSESGWQDCEGCTECVERVDVLVGGFPCQDISNAGLRAGIDGERSGLWREFHRLIGDLRPRYVVVENVSALLVRGIGRVLGDLASIGYDAEWDRIPASAVGAAHERERIWIVAYPAEADDARDLLGARGVWESQIKHRGLCRYLGGFTAWDRALEPQPRMVRVVDGLPKRLDDRLSSLGNAIVPQIAEWIARRILEAEGVTGVEARPVADCAVDPVDGTTAER